MILAKNFYLSSSKLHGLLAALLASACLWSAPSAQAQEFALTSETNSVTNSAATPISERSCLSSSSSHLLKLQTLHARYLALKADRHALGQSALELGLHLQQMGRYLEAQRALQEAVQALPEPVQRAHALLALGNVEVELGRRDLAQVAYRDALNLAPDVAAIRVSVALNQLALLGSKQISQPALNVVVADLAQVPDLALRARLWVQYVLQAKRSTLIDAALLEAGLQQAWQLADKLEASYLQVEIIDQQAQLFEEQARDADLMRVSDRAILLLQHIDAPELMISIEARRARVFARHQQTQNAIKSFSAAIRYIQAIRQDIPISYAQGRSNLREIIDPVYLGLADALLTHSEQSSPAERAALLYQVRDVVEKIKQNQFDDYLGNRCSSVAASSNKDSGAAKTLSLAAGTAVLYPIVFPDRLELLLETSEGMVRHRVAIKADQLNQNVAAFSSALRANQAYQTLARRLHKVLLAPLEQDLASKKIQTLVIVPDGVLRLLAFAALHDGQQYAIEKYAIAISPGLGIIAQQDRLQDASPTRLQGSATSHRVLLAGVSEPGTVVERLPDELVDQLLQADDVTTRELRGKVAQQRALRQLGASVPTQSNQLAKSSAEDGQAIADKLRQILRLDGVQAEITSLHAIVPGTMLLNQEFSARHFTQQVRSGQYDIVHVASHGIFGNSADKTFILAHDELITIDQLQSLLAVDGTHKRPLDLLILSACETAEGDDRAPLGISGAALKAKARSAMGSLWPVSDLAASQLMQQVYENYVNQGQSKAQSLRHAQLSLMRQAAYAHPSYWAAFIMVGNWQ